MLFTGLYVKGLSDLMRNRLKTNNSQMPAGYASAPPVWLAMVVLISQSGATRLINAAKCKREDYKDYVMWTARSSRAFQVVKTAFVLDEKQLPGAARGKIM